MSDGPVTDLDPRQVVAPGVLELDLDAIDPIAGVLCGARVWALHEGDALELKLPPECADALIMDPPAGIGFMGRAWDSDKGGMEQWIAWAAKLFAVAFDALKPGAHGAVWALPRTADWTMQALRRAGFEIREVVVHCFGSGFPKSLSVQKAIESAGGNGDRFAGWGTALKPAHECWIIVRKPLRGTVAANVLAHGTGGLNIDAARVGTGGDKGIWPVTDRPTSSNSMGDKNPAPTDNAVGRWPSNLVLSHSSWDESECRACGVVAPFVVRFCPACGSGDVGAKRGGCRCVGERRVRGNDQGPLDDSGCPPSVALGDRLNSTRSAGYATDGLETVDAWECLATCERCGVSALVPSGGDASRCACGFGRRWACAVALLDEQSGNRPSGAMAAGTLRGPGNVVYGAVSEVHTKTPIEASEGGASRFFHCFPPEPFEPPPLIYSAKPSTAEREAGLSGEAGHEPLPKRTAGELTGREDSSAGTQSPRAGAGRASAGRANHHPTIKGFHLIGHFLDLLVPPGGLVLDLTAGSGTLGAVVAHRHAATRWRCIMAELDPEHCRIIRERCRYWGARPWRPGTKAVAKPKVVAPAKQPSLFGRGVP